MKNLEGLHARAKALRLHGLLAHWSEAIAEPALAKTGGWVEQMLDWEEQERARRSLERRLQNAHIGRFKAVCDFDWTWPKRCDRATFEALMSLDFMCELHPHEISIHQFIPFPGTVYYRRPAENENRAEEYSARES